MIVRELGLDAQPLGGEGREGMAGLPKVRQAVHGKGGQTCGAIAPARGIFRRGAGGGGQEEIGGGHRL